MAADFNKRAFRVAGRQQREREWTAEGRAELHSLVRDVSDERALLYNVLWTTCFDYLDDTQLLVYGLLLQLAADPNPAVRRAKRHVSRITMARALRWCVDQNAPDAMDD